jgi:hypothetical protein
MDRTQGTGDAPGRGGEHGWAEVVVLLLFAALIGFAFLWALVLHEKPPDESAVGTSGTTTVTLTPPTLPPPHKYVVDGGVNIRQGPATNTEILTRIEDGQKVRVICRTEGQDVTGSDGSTNLWLRIDLGGFGVGYASALYVDVGDDIEDASRIGDCLLAPPA